MPKDGGRWQGCHGRLLEEGIMALVPPGNVEAKLHWKGETKQDSENSSCKASETRVSTAF